jgi:hypothetical protein
MKRWVGVGLALGFGLGLAGAATVRTFRHGVYYMGESAEERSGLQRRGGRSAVFPESVPGGRTGLLRSPGGGHLRRERQRTLWFEDEEKTIRNVWVEEGRLVRLRRGGTYEDRP